MNVTIARSTLADALKVVSPAIGKGRGLPILAMVRINAGDGVVDLTATNLDLTISTAVETEPSVTAEDGIVLVPGSLLASIVGSMAGDTVQLAENDDVLELYSGGTSASLRTMGVENWPKALAAKGKPGTLSADAVAALAHIVKFASPEESHGTHTGVRFDDTGIMATDRYRAIRHQCKGLPDATVPTASVAAVLRATDGPVEMTADERLVTFTAGPTTWTSTLLAGEYPAAGLVKMWADDYPHTLEFDAAELLASIGRVSMLGDEKVTITPEGASATLSAVASEVGGIEDVIDMAGDFGEPIMLNAGFTVQVIEAAGAERIAMQIQEPHKPIVVDGERTSMLIVPLRIPKVDG